MAKIDERIATLQTRLQQLKAQQQRTAAKQKALESKRTRKADTRRKILIGSIVLARVEQGRFSETELRGWMDEALTRADDRALFDLPGRANTAAS
jgi:septal ring factor EnvC (AmiA/AmiB activator)